MLIGEAFGAEEEKSGKPFIGKAGILLNKILASVSLDRSGVFITNAVKCRPPQNRPPSKKEILACRQYLITEIREVKPELIICLGGTALKALTQQFQISIQKARYKKWRIHNAQVRCTYHPAATFRTPYFFKLLLEDFRRFLDPDDEEKRTALIRTIVPRVQRQEYLGALSGPTAFDIETTGLDPFQKDSKIWTVGFSSKAGKAEVIPLWHPEGYNADPKETLAQIAEVFKKEDLTIIGHNLKFDLRFVKVLCKRYDIPFRVDCQIFDTMIAFHLLDENYPNKSLKHLAMRYTDMGDYAKAIKELGKDKEKYKDMLFPLKLMAKYNGDDADCTLRLYQEFQERLVAEGLDKYMRFNMKILLTLLEMECNGVKVDREVVFKLEKKYQEELHALETRIKSELGDVLLTSPKQLSQALYVEKKYPIVVRTEKGAPSTSTEALDALAKFHKCKVAKDLLRFRSVHKLLSSYILRVEEKTSQDGMIHTTYHMASNREADGSDTRGGTVTGRLGSDMQQIPKEGGIKEMFVSRFKDGWICQADYSQIELRVLAHFTQDKNMIAAFAKEHVDIHRRVAAKIYHKTEEEVTDEERRRTKTINFGIAYCMGPMALAAQLNISETSAKRFIREWYANYPQVETWIKRTQLQVVKTGCIRTLFGRKRRLVGGNFSTSVGREVLRQGVNSPIQGTASELTLYSTYLLQRFLQTHKAKSKVMLNVHDSVIVDVHPSEKDSIAADITRIFTTPPIEKVFGVKFLVPLEIDVKMGRTWEAADAA